MVADALRNAELRRRLLDEASGIACGLLSIAPTREHLGAYQLALDQAHDEIEDAHRENAELRKRLEKVQREAARIYDVADALIDDHVERFSSSGDDTGVLLQ